MWNVLLWFRLERLRRTNPSLNMVSTRETPLTTYFLGCVHNIDGWECDYDDDLGVYNADCTDVSVAVVMVLLLTD